MPEQILTIIELSLRITLLIIERQPPEVSKQFWDNHIEFVNWIRATFPFPK